MSYTVINFYIHVSYACQTQSIHVMMVNFKYTTKNGVFTANKVNLYTYTITSFYFS